MSYRDVEELLRERGVAVDHTTVFRWAQRYAPALDKRCRPHLTETNDSYRVDETYSKIKKQWYALYRAVDSAGQTIDFLLSARRVHRKQEEAQTNQAMCLNLITNAVVGWNTVYMQAVLHCLGTEGLPVEEDDLAHLSPAQFEHVNPYGKSLFPIEQAVQRQGLRPLRAA